MDTTQRAAFEAWAISEVFAVHRNGGEQYVNTATQHAWTGWQASRKQMAEHICTELDAGAASLQAEIDSQPPSKSLEDAAGYAAACVCVEQIASITAAIRSLSSPEGGL